jgi:hypothetical protein
MAQQELLALQRDAGAEGSELIALDESAQIVALARLVELAAAEQRADAEIAAERVLLHAATRWVFASLQSQPLESPRRRSEVRNLLQQAGQPQMLLELGRAHTAQATPRRPHSELRANEERA